jgi:hypothetical protein
VEVAGLFYLARADLAAARRLIDTHGYHRRDAEPAAAEQAAHTRSS